jgi:hypothetical protein
MSLVGFKAQNHVQQVLVNGPRDDVDDRGTTPEVFDPLHERFGFTVDVAAAPHNAKLRALLHDRAGRPGAVLGGRARLVQPALQRHRAVGGEGATFSGAELVVMLLPANRTEQRWWQRTSSPTATSRAGCGASSCRAGSASSSPARSTSARTSARRSAAAC